MIVEGSGFYYPQITGVKTGTLEEAGRCLITTAQKDGYEYLLVLMGAPYLDGAGGYVTPNQAFVLTAKFYDWVFDTYKAKTIVEKGDKVSSINNVRRIAYNNNGERIGENDYVTAPIEKGAKMGTLKLILYGSELGSVDLIAAESVEESPMLVLMDKISQFFQNFWFRFAFLFVVLVVLFAIIINIIQNKRRKKYRRVNRRRYL